MPRINSPRMFSSKNTIDKMAMETGLEEKSKIKTIVELNKIKNYKNGTKVGVVNVLLDNDKIGSVSVYIKKKAQKKKKFLFSS